MSHCSTSEEPADCRAGVELLQEFKSSKPEMPVVMISAFGDIEMAVECMHLGASDFIKKPADISELRQRLHRAMENARVFRQAVQLEERLEQLDPADLVGNSPPMQEVKRLVQMVAQDGYATVLITGETGTGKDLVARAIHRAGWRAKEPFVPVAVSSLNPSIVESELFGHEAGAFTGATGRRLGFIEKAHGGVLMLDEVGDLPEQAQLKLLRFLEDRIFTRAGSSQEIKVDVQVVAATNRDLEKAVADGKIRKDFYYRLKSVQLTLSPLRERISDIALLARHFLGQFRSQGRTRIVDVSRDAQEAMDRYDWPGNVRELRAVLERAVIHANQVAHESIRSDDLPLEVASLPPAGRAVAGGRPTAEAVDLDLEIARIELGYIEEALRTANERKSDAWRLLGLNDRFALRRRVLSLLGKYPELAANYPRLQRLYARGR
jgi:DNA-binding NtrC family response regulator